MAAAIIESTRKVTAVDFTRSLSRENSQPSFSMELEDKEQYQYGDRLVHADTNMTTDTKMTSFEATGQSGRIYKDNGELVLLPAPTKDPKDPLNMEFKYKFLGLFCLCFFGALAASAELILGSMLPVFALEYAHINPKILEVVSSQHLLPKGEDPLVFISKLPGAPPIWHTYLLGSMPLLIMGLTNLVLIPMSISIGRRPVILGAGVTAIAGALWAGFSQSLGSHIGARCLQAVGAGTIESLIPFVIQDVVFFHQRNTWISGAFAAQGTIIIALGVAAPYMIIYLSWRWVYYITAAGAAFFLIGVVLFMPETRWHRTRAEMNGTPRPIEKELDHSPRTWEYNLALMRGPTEWNKGLEALKDSMTTFFYPHIFFITMLNSAMIATAFAGAFTVTPTLLGEPYNWPFLHLGLCLIAIIIAAIAVAGVTGKLADVLANFLAKRRGVRQPENQLINLILPVICGIVGTLLFGLAGQNPYKYPWQVFLLALGMMSFSFLGTSTVGAVYVLEAYPQLAGPALVNIASFRCILAFALSFKVSEWIVQLGYLKSMLIYLSLIAFFASLIPVVFVFGPRWRKRWPGPDR